MSYLDRIAECNRHDLAGFLPFEVENRRAGWVRRSLAGRLADLPEVFAVEAERIGFAAGLDTADKRSCAVAGVVEAWRREGLLRRLSGELFAVGNGAGREPLLLIDRSAMQTFGFGAVGVHLNGYVCGPDGLHVWVAERAAGRHSYPGMLDNMVAGGQPAGLSLMENVVKEAGEEAGIPRARSPNAPGPPAPSPTAWKPKPGCAPTCSMSGTSNFPPASIRTPATERFRNSSSGRPTGWPRRSGTRNGSSSTAISSISTSLSATAFSTRKTRTMRPSSPASALCSPSIPGGCGSLQGRGEAGGSDGP